MTKSQNSYDRAVHSDFLIHWTGRDIDCEHQPNWYNDEHRSRTCQNAETEYLRRLQYIVTYGLWMTKEDARTFKVGSRNITIPSTPLCCFTELRLSESRRHAKSYGRLGIGVKRPFLFRRFGRPLAYFGYGERSCNDKLLEACSTELKDKSLLNFFKPMNSHDGLLTYDLYSESEWRVLFRNELLEKRAIIDPRDSANAKEHAYFKSLTPTQQEKLSYLIPLDGWFSMIIYPSLNVRNRVQWEDKLGINTEIRRIKSVGDDHGNKVEGLQEPVRGNWPIEVHLDNCRNF